MYDNIDLIDVAIPAALVATGGGSIVAEITMFAVVLIVFCALAYRYINRGKRYRPKPMKDK